MLSLIVALVLTAQDAPREFVGPPDMRKVEMRSPGDVVNPKVKAKPSKAARYRAYQRRYEAEQAEQAQAQREYEARMAPIWAAQAARQQDMQMRAYEAGLRHQENMDFNDALRGVTRPR